MPTSYQLDPAAHEELVAAMAWYDTEVDGLGLAFLEEFHAVAQRAARFPESGTPIDGSPIDTPIRRFVFKRFKHAIYALTVDGTLLIFAVAHQHQRPGYWRKRLRRASRSR